MLRNVNIVEVGPRDGLQNEKQIVSTGDKFQFIKLLAIAGVKTLEATSFVKADKIPQMQDAAELVKLIATDKSLKNIKASCLVPNLMGLKNAIANNVSEIAIFTASSNSFNKKNINANIDESLVRLKEVSDYIKENDLKINTRGYISTVFGCPYEGNIEIDQTLRITEKLLDMGVYEISLGDTIGVANPTQVVKFINILKAHFDLSHFAMHFHDTEGMALANIYASFEEGITTFDSSAGGLGGCPYAVGATGNVATDDVVNMFTKMNVVTGIDEQKLHEASAFILNVLGKTSSSKYFNARSARGIK